MTYRLNGHVLPLGSVSTGTLRTEDLLLAFCNEFHKYVTPVPEYVIEAECWLEGDKETIYSEWSEDTRWEDIGTELVGTLLENLSSIAPEGTTFASLPGDGSDFGWWETSDAE